VATHPIDLSTRVIDSGVIDERLNRVDGDIWELTDNVAIVESFSHCVTVNTGDGLMCFDASGAQSGAKVVEAIRTWSSAPISHLVYTHGHLDHVGGSGAFLADANARGLQRPRVVSHEAVLPRFARYDDMSDFNNLINRRQFGGIRADQGLGVGGGAGELAPAAGGAGSAGGGRPVSHRFLPEDALAPDHTFRESLSMSVGNLAVEMHHDRGETDDHLWAWFPEKKWIVTGDFIIWNFPNAGNPQKVQRYAAEWARALRRMVAMGPELLLPAHGLPIVGKERIAMVLGEIATALESLVTQVIHLMNDGATLDTIVHSVKVPDAVLAKPYLRPLYDEPEFVVRGIWRLYGGWWDGAASRLKPSPDAVLGTEIASLAGGADVLIARAKGLAEDGDMRLACHLADFAGWAAPDDIAVHTRRAEIYELRRKQELSLMSKGIFRAAARESEAVVKRQQ
jgi:alkyl sulfatase BDS1-like metallo-beta-lactamase superfamily hydrolase